MGLLLLSARAGQAPVGFVVTLFLAVFFGSSLLASRVMGVFRLYLDFPADRTDPIEENLGWQQVEFGAFRGHSPMSVTFGKRCLHLKQPFPFQLLFWKGPASIPWGEVSLEREPSQAWWAFLSSAQFRLGAGGRLIRLRGKAGRRLMEKVKGVEAEARSRPLPSPGPGAIRPT